MQTASGEHRSRNQQKGETAWGKGGGEGVGWQTDRQTPRQN